MKKWTVLGFFLLISVMLVACGSDEKTVKLQAEQNGVSMELTYKAEGDKVIEQSADNVLPYESMGVTNAEEAEKELEAFTEGYDDLEGVEHDMDFQDDKVIETLTIDYEKADLSEVGDLPGSTFEGNVEEGVSLEKSIEALEQQGFEVVE